VVNVVLLGPPGAGKGTQAPIVAKAIRGDLLATGDLLRQAVRDGTPHGIEAREYMEHGELVPDEIVLAIVAERLAAQDRARGFVFDGFPRTVPQAQALDEALAALGQRVDHVISIDVPREVLLDRLAGRSASGRDGTAPSRSDDRPDAVARRLDVYTRQTAPLRAYYREHETLREIDGNRPMADVTQQILRALGGAPATQTVD
jgi:adenylate kinase